MKPILIAFIVIVSIIVIIGIVLIALWQTGKLGKLGDIKLPSVTDLPEVTDLPTNPPTYEPTNPPTNPPTYEPTNPPTYEPTYEPTNPPTMAPTYEPTNPPTDLPTLAPTYEPTDEPTSTPKNYTMTPDKIPDTFAFYRVPPVKIDLYYLDNTTPSEYSSIYGTYFNRIEPVKDLNSAITKYTSLFENDTAQYMITFKSPTEVQCVYFNSDFYYISMIDASTVGLSADTYIKNTATNNNSSNNYNVLSSGKTATVGSNGTALSTGSIDWVRPWSEGVNQPNNQLEICKIMCSKNTDCNYFIRTIAPSGLNSCYFYNSSPSLISGGNLDATIYSKN